MVASTVWKQLDHVVFEQLYLSMSTSTDLEADMGRTNIPDDFDFLDADLNLKGLPVEELAELRARKKG